MSLLPPQHSGAKAKPIGTQNRVRPSPMLGAAPRVSGINAPRAPLPAAPHGDPRVTARPRARHGHGGAAGEVPRRHRIAAPDPRVISEARGRPAPRTRGIHRVSDPAEPGAAPGRNGTRAARPSAPPGLRQTLGSPEPPPAVPEGPEWSHPRAVSSARPDQTGPGVPWPAPESAAATTGGRAGAGSPGRTRTAPLGSAAPTWAGRRPRRTAPLRAPAPPRTAPRCSDPPQPRTGARHGAGIRQGAGLPYSY